MNLKPLGDRIFVRPDPEPEQTESGLHLRRNWTPKQSGTVVAVGETTCEHCKRVRPTDIKVGDWVLFSWQVGQDVTLNDGQESFLIIPIRDVLAVESV